MTWNSRSLAGAAVVALALGAAAPLGAQQVQTITFEQALDLALERNPTLRLVQNAAELSDITVRQERTQFLPDLRLNTSSSRQYGRNFSPDEGRILNTQTQSLNAGVSSSMTIFDGFSNVAQLQQAQLARTASEADVERARQTVVFTVMSNFLGLIEQQEQLRVQEENLAAQEAQEAQIKAFVEAGARPISDLYQQQATTASARLALVQTRRALELARMQLIRTLQLEPFGEYRFEAPALGEAPAEGAGADLAALYQQASAQRADLSAAQAELDAAEQGVRVARASRWPSLSLNVGYNSGFNSASDMAFWDQFDQRRGGSVGLGISLPVFDRLSTSSQTQRARVQVENAKISLESLRQEVAIQIRTAQLDLESAREQLRQAEAQRSAAEQALEASRQRYQVGAATLVELSQAQAAQVRAAGDLVSARYGLLFQDRLMDYYVGSLTTAELLDR